MYTQHPRPLHDLVHSYRKGIFSYNQMLLSCGRGMGQGLPFYFGTGWAPGVHRGTRMACWYATDAGHVGWHTKLVYGANPTRVGAPPSLCPGSWGVMDHAWTMDQLESKDSSRRPPGGQKWVPRTDNMVSPYLEGA